LHKSFPEDPIVGEEDSKDLRGEEGRQMREKVLELANSGLDQALTEDSVCSIICFFLFYFTLFFEAIKHGRSQLENMVIMKGWGDKKGWYRETSIDPLLISSNRTK
jgi:hypothetical protein